MFRRIVVLVFGVIIVGCSSALTLKAAIGVGAWDALAQTGSDVMGIEVGTVGMCFNFLCILVQMVVLRKDFKIIQFLQIPVSILLGIIINFMLYQVYNNFIVTEYWINVVLLILGYIICAFAVGIVMVLDIVTFALEGACMAVSKVSGKKFHVLRQGVDVISVLLVMIIVLVTGVTLAVREGTIIGVLLFGPMMGIFMKLQKPIFKKLNLIDYN